MTDDTTKAKDEARALQLFSNMSVRNTLALIHDVRAERDAELQVLLDELIRKRFAPADDADNRGLTWRVHAEVWRKIEALRAEIQKRIQEGSAG